MYNCSREVIKREGASRDSQFHEDDEKFLEISKVFSRFFKFQFLLAFASFVERVGMVNFFNHLYFGVQFQGKPVSFITILYKNRRPEVSHIWRYLEN